jgi:hypothetical protein
MNNFDYKDEAFDQTKKGGDIERASVLATLAVAQAIEDLASELRSLGTEAFPVHGIRMR